MLGLGLDLGINIFKKLPGESNGQPVLRTSEISFSKLSLVFPSLCYSVCLPYDVFLRFPYGKIGKNCIVSRAECK